MRALMYGIVAAPWALVAAYLTLNMAVFVVSGTWWFPGEGLR